MVDTERDEAGLIVGGDRPPVSRYLTVGMVAGAMAVGVLVGWAFGSNGDEQLPPPTTVGTAVDSARVASCQRAITLARQGFGYSTEVLDSAETAMTAAALGRSFQVEEAKARMRRTTASILDIAPRFNEAAARC